MHLFEFDPKNIFLTFLLFISSCHSFDPPAPATITTPTTITSDIIAHHPTLIIELKKDGTVWYRSITKEKENMAIRVVEPITRNLTKVIADYKKQNADQKVDYWLRGEPDTKYPTFENAITALRNNEEFKYSLMVAPADNISDSSINESKRKKRH